MLHHDKNPFLRRILEFSQNSCAGLSYRTTQQRKKKEEESMALGKQIGAFTLKETSTTVTPGSGTAPTLHINLQGQVTGEAGEGVAFGTMTMAYEPNLKSGTWSYCGMSILNKGGGRMVNSQGTWESTGHLKFRHHGTAQYSDGRTGGIEFEVDAASEIATLSGKLYEWR
jgi:hypothetical protein